MREADWLVDMGPGAGEHGGGRRRGNGGSGDAPGPVGHRRLPLRQASDRGAGAARRGPGELPGARRSRAQPEGHRRRVPGRQVRLRHGRLGLRQVDARQRDRLQGAREPAAEDAHEAGRPRVRRGHRLLRQGDRDRPDADRAHAAVEPGDLHRPVHARPRALLADARGQGARLQARPLLVQRPRGRCETCKGDGQIKIEMHFLPTSTSPARRVTGVATTARRSRCASRASRSPTCSRCRSRRRSSSSRRSRRSAGGCRRSTTVDYIRLGQPATTLSGGEARGQARRRALEGRHRPDALHPRRADGDHFAIEKLLEVLQRPRGCGQHGARDRAQPRRDQAGGLDRRPRARAARPGAR